MPTFLHFTVTQSNIIYVYGDRTQPLTVGIRELYCVYEAETCFFLLQRGVWWDVEHKEKSRISRRFAGAVNVQRRLRLVCQEIKDGKLSSPG